MTAYMIVFLDKQTDDAGIKEYRRLGIPTLKEHNAIPRSKPNSQVVTLEGPAPLAVVMLEFPTVEAAKAWYNSPGYQAALPHRLKAAECRAVIVEGM